MSAVQGEMLREETLDLLADMRRDWVHLCREAMIALYQERVTEFRYFGSEAAPCVNGDDATEWLEAQRCPFDRRLVGAVFRAGSGWQYAGTVHSRLKQRHARRISCWQWVGE